MVLSTKHANTYTPPAAMAAVQQLKDMPEPEPPARTETRVPAQRRSAPAGPQQLRASPGAASSLWLLRAALGPRQRAELPAPRGRGGCGADSRSRSARPRHRLCGLRAPPATAATAARGPPGPAHPPPGPRGSNAPARRVPASSAARGRDEGAARLAGIGRCRRRASRSPWQVPALPRQHHGAAPAGAPHSSLLLGSLLPPASPRPPSVGPQRVPARRGKPAGPFRGRRRKGRGGRAAIGAGGPGRGRRQTRRAGPGPAASAALCAPGRRCSAPHTVLHPAQAAAGILCEEIAGGAAKGRGEIRYAVVVAPLISQGNQFIIEGRQSSQA